MVVIPTADHPRQQILAQIKPLTMAQTQPTTPLVDQSQTITPPPPPPPSSAPSASPTPATATSTTTSTTIPIPAADRSGSQQDMDLNTVGGENGKLGLSPPGSYTRIPPRSIDPSIVPPILPPHLLQVILNDPDKANTTILPQPNHVMLNHLYALSIKDGIMVLSATHRFRKKYVTTLLYKPI